VSDHRAADHHDLDDENWIGPAIPSLLREMNERLVMDVIRETSSVSRAEVSRRTGLSKPTVSLAFRTLEASGLVARIGLESGRPGRSGVLYRQVADAALAVAVEITVSGVRAELVDLEGHGLATNEREFVARHASEIFDAVAQCITDVLRTAGRRRDEVEAVTVGTPGVINPGTGRLDQAGTLPELDGSNPGIELSNRLGYPVTVLNDVELAALGEQADGAGRDVSDFAVVWVGAGLGSALVLGGQLHRGHRGAAGEVFDIPFRRAIAVETGSDGNGPRIDASAAGIVELADAARTKHPASMLLPPFDARTVLDAAATDDSLGVEVRDRLAQWIAWYAAAIAAIADPELIVLAGPIGSHDTLRAPVAAELAGLLTEPPHIASSKLGDRAVLAGAISEGRRDAAERSFVDRVLTREN